MNKQRLRLGLKLLPLFALVAWFGGPKLAEAACPTIGVCFPGVTIPVNGLTVQAGGAQIGGALQVNSTATPVGGAIEGGINAVNTIAVNGTPVTLGGTPTPRATDTPIPARATDTPIPPVATDTPIPAAATATPQINAALTRSTPAANTFVYFPGIQGTPGTYATVAATATAVSTATPAPTATPCAGYPCGNNITTIGPTVGTGGTWTTAAQNTFQTVITLGSTLASGGSYDLDGQTQFSSSNGGPSLLTCELFDNTNSVFITGASIALDDVNSDAWAFIPLRYRYSGYAGTPSIILRCKAGSINGTNSVAPGSDGAGNAPANYIKATRVA